MVRLMSERARDSALAGRSLARLLPKLIAWHRWWFRDRDPEKTGLAVTFHPWESGQDNSPAWMRRSRRCLPRRAPTPGGTPVLSTPRVGHAKRTMTAMSS